MKKSHRFVAGIISVMSVFTVGCSSPVQNVQDTQNVQNVQDVQNTQNAQNTQNVQDAQNVQNAQNTQNTQSAQNVQDTQNTQSAQNTQNTQNAQGTQNVQNAQGIQNSNSITEADAKNIALSNAGVSETDIIYITVKQDWDDGRAEYEVDFIAGGMEYEYEIDAASGNVISWEAEYVYD